MTDLPTEPRALDQLRAELLALDRRALIAVNTDVASAALVAIGAAREVREHRAEIARLVGEPMCAPLDRLDLIARAALDAHSQHRAIESGADLVPYVAAVNEHRDLLRQEVRTLITRRILPPGMLRELTHGQGYKNIAFDVLQLVAALRGSWEITRHKTALTTRELDEAEAAANALVTAVGVRDMGARSPSGDLRQRAFTLLVTTYDEVQRLVWFVRWHHGDASRIAPSLFVSRPRRRRSGNAANDAMPEIDATGAEGRR